MIKALADCDYTAFISYAHADDVAWFNWITDFRTELERGLQARLRGVRLPRLHLSADNGPVSGFLSEELQERVAASWSMIIVVHDNYAASEWCLRELEYFKSLFGDDGFRERLYIVALSEEAIAQVTASESWKRLVPGDPLWIPFYEPTERDRPVPVYLDKGLVSPKFREPFERLREDYVRKLKRAAAAPPAPAAAAAPSIVAPAAAPAAPGAGAAALPIVFGIGHPEAAAAVGAVAEPLRAAGLPVSFLDTAAVFGDFGALAGARALVLPFDDRPPLLTFYPGGHLALQRDSWLKRGKPPERLHWLDLRQPPGGEAAAGGGAAFVASIGGRGLDPATLQRVLNPPTPSADAAVRIYIESNRNERSLWEPLGEQIRRKWDEVFAALDPARMPPLSLRANGLPVDQIDQFPRLDDADGVVLLWGKKTSDALVAQIHKVEGKLPGRDGAPGIVAYLMPPQQGDEPIPAWGWQVLRFNAADEQAIDVVDEERDELKRFLRKVFERWRRREAAGS